MTDETPTPPAAAATVQVIPIQPGFPSHDFATIYVDGVTSILPGPQVVKAYFGRLEPSLNAEAKSQTTPVIQIVMSTVGFLQTAAFYDVIVQRMLREKTISQAEIDAAKKYAGG